MTENDVTTIDQENVKPTLPLVPKEPPVEDFAPRSMTIKKMLYETRRKIREGCERRDEETAKWLARAVDALTEIETRDALFDPRQLEPEQNALLATPEQVQNVMNGAVAMAQGAAAMAQASGLPVPQTVARQYFTLTVHLMRAARGLPPVRRGVARAKAGRVFEAEIQ